MCGIAGYVFPGQVDDTGIHRMNAALTHRGPDDVGVFIDRTRTVCLGHRRLSIIDLDGGQQPLSNGDKSLWITYNGEIYNYKEVRASLEEKYHFKTKSDTEVILHLYEEKGEACLEDLRGMFAFAVYDLSAGKLFLARDHLGQKPLFYYHDFEKFAFASEIKALLALDPSLAQLDPEALYEYLSLRIITSPRSMFKKIRKLPAGHFLVFQNGAVNVRRYWDLKFHPKMKGSFNEISAELDALVAQTVRYHLVSDVPVGAFLSGGLDSSLIVSFMRKVSDERIKTFSGDVAYKGFSEIPFARLVAERCKTDHHELAIKPSLVRALSDLVWHLDEPSDALAVCVYYLAEFARKEVKVVLGGDGGDELFGGYDRYYGNILVDHYALLPEGLRKTFLDGVLKLVPESFWYRSYSHQLRWIHQMSFSTGGDRYAKSLGYFYFSDGYKKTLYTEEFQKRVGMFDPEQSIRRFFDSENASETVDRMLYADSMTRMPDHPNMILDRMTMAHGLEARSPFLDHRMAEFCAKIPSHYKVRRLTRRYIEMQLGKKYLPPPLLRRGKQGFSSALPYLLGNEFKLLYRVFLAQSSLARDGYLKQKGIDSLLSEHLGNKVDHGNRLWLLCNAEVWYRMYIEHQDRENIKSLLERSTPSRL